MVTSSDADTYQVDHRLDGEHVARLHDTLGLVLGVVGHVGLCVEEHTRTMAAVGLHH
jgi:hypothetical protein